MDIDKSAEVDEGEEEDVKDREEGDDENAKDNEGK